jgi:hypothetical protein
MPQYLFIGTFKLRLPKFKPLTGSSVPQTPIVGRIKQHTFLTNKIELCHPKGQATWLREAHNEAVKQRLQFDGA